MGLNMTSQQLRDLIAGVVQGLKPGTGGGNGAGRAVGAAASVVGRLGPCELGRDKIKRYKKFIDWVSEAEAKMSLLQITDNNQKINFLRSSAGAELKTFWDKEARAQWETVGDTVADTYFELIQLSKDTLLKYVSRDRALIDVLHMPQGDSSIMEFVGRVEDQAALCRVGERAIMPGNITRAAGREG